MWLYNNFTNVKEIQDSVNELTRSLFPDRQVLTEESELDTKKIIFVCRENFFKLLRLKKPKSKSKKPQTSVRNPSKTRFTNTFSLCRLPIEGKSIKLQSFSIFSPKLPIKPGPSPLPPKTSEIYHPELYDLLIKQYKHQSKFCQISSPEPLSPRFFKLSTAKSSQSISPHFHASREIKNRSSMKKELETVLTPQNFLKRTRNRVHSSKVLNRLIRDKLM